MGIIARLAAALIKKLLFWNQITSNSLQFLLPPPTSFSIILTSILSIFTMQVLAFVFTLALAATATALPQAGSRFVCTCKGADGKENMPAFLCNLSGGILRDGECGGLAVGSQLSTRDCQSAGVRGSTAECSAL
ncbi:hypothetical protein RB595_003536 [Gaeumannomyces hyphopodioides]